MKFIDFIKNFRIGFKYIEAVASFLSQVTTPIDDLVNKLLDIHKKDDTK